MKRMVDDKEIREFDDRITALEQGGTGGSYTAGNGINIDENNEITAKLGDNLVFDRRGNITTSWNVLATDSQGKLNTALGTNNSNGYAIYTTYDGTSHESRFSYSRVQVGDSGYAAQYEADGINYYLDQFNSVYPQITINAGQANTLTKINLPHNDTQGTTVSYTLADRDWVNNCVSTKVMNKVDTNVTFDDDTNPEGYNIMQPTAYDGDLRIFAFQDDNSHPSDTEIRLNPARIILEANDYNHGIDDDTYTGSIQITDSSVTIGATDGTNTNSLVITPTQVTLNGSAIDAPSTYQLALGSGTTQFFFTTITAETGLEGSYVGDDYWTFVTKYARYVTWYYENSSDTAGDNHKLCTLNAPGQTLSVFLADGTTKVTSIPWVQVTLTVTKTN